MSFTHYIDGIEVNEPNEWPDFEQEIARDFDKRMVTVQYPGDATFTKGGYRRLRDMFMQSDCGIAVYEAYDECDGVRILLVRANIILADCEWNLNRCEVSCSLVDDGIMARIDNNRKIPMSPRADLSKNGVPITPALDIPLEVFATQTGAYLPDPRKAFDWLAVMQNAVQYLTDSNITLVSSWYNSLPDNERWAMLSGHQLRSADTAVNADRITYTFEDLFQDMAKTYNLWMVVQRDNNGNPFIVIEQEEALFSTAVAADFPWQDNLVQSVDRDQLWATVTIASKEALRNQDNVQSLPYLILQGFSEESFAFTGICNTDAELDLKRVFAWDTNLIESVIGPNTNHPELVFFIQYDRTTNQATRNDWLNPGGLPVLYNEAGMNSKVLNRYALPSNVGSNVAPQTASFRARRTSTGVDYIDNSTGFNPSPIVDPAPFQATLVDPGSNYTPSTYTAPAQGYYVIRVTRLWQIVENSFALAGFGPQLFLQKKLLSKIFIRRRNSLSVVVQTFQDQRGFEGAQFNIFTPAGLYEHVFSQGMQLNAGDTVEVLFQFIGSVSFGAPAGQVVARDLPNSIFESTFVATGGGVLTNVDVDAARIITYDFERFTPATRWANMLGDPSLAVRVAPDENLKLGHIATATRNISKGTTTYTLICKRDQK
jgi:hypothetical protein